MGKINFCALWGNFTIKNILILVSLLIVIFLAWLISQNFSIVLASMLSPLIGVYLGWGITSDIEQKRAEREKLIEQKRLEREKLAAFRYVVASLFLARQKLFDFIWQFSDALLCNALPISKTTDLPNDIAEKYLYTLVMDDGIKPYPILNFRHNIQQLNLARERISQFFPNALDRTKLSSENALVWYGIMTICRHFRDNFHSEEAKTKTQEIVSLSSGRLSGIIDNLQYRDTEDFEEKNNFYALLSSALPTILFLLQNDVIQIGKTLNAYVANLSKESSKEIDNLREQYSGLLSEWKNDSLVEKGFMQAMKGEKYSVY